MNKIKFNSLVALLIVGVLFALFRWFNFPSFVGDSCDIKNYRTVQIGTKTWMAENLNCYVIGSKCYNNDTANCTKYGRLYNWAAVMALPSGCNNVSCANRVNTPHRGICPEGWHIPSNAEWNALYRFADGTNNANSLYDSHTAGRYLKAKEGWYNYEGSLCEDSFGFSALPAGVGYSDDSFEFIGEGCSWWSVSEDDEDYAYSRGLAYNSDYAGWLDRSKDHLFSVRCVRD